MATAGDRLADERDDHRDHPGRFALKLRVRHRHVGKSAEVRLQPYGLPEINRIRNSFARSVPAGSRRSFGIDLPAADPYGSHAEIARRAAQTA